jgi:hypothetical protein
MLNHAGVPYMSSPKLLNLAQSLLVEVRQFAATISGHIAIVSAITVVVAEQTWQHLIDDNLGRCVSFV